MQKEGATVVVADLNLDEAVVSKIKENEGQALAVKVNVTLQEDLENLVKTTIDTFGRIDILVNNAGIFDKYTNSLERTDEQ